MLFVVALSSMQLSAQDPTGAELLKQSKIAYDALQDMKADYRVSINSPMLDSLLVMNGTLKASKKKFYFTFPETGQEMFCDGKYIWAVEHKDAMVIVSEYDARTAAGPYQYFSWYEESGVRVIDNGSIDGVKSVILVDFPEDSDIITIELNFNKEELIQRALFKTKDGTWYEYLTLNIKTNTGLSDDIFKIDRRELEMEGYYFGE